MPEIANVATRKAYGDALVYLGEKYENLFVMDADLSGSTMTGIFKAEFPDRHINCGIAEGNMISTAAGMASTGQIVFASSFAVFATGRALEQIRNSVAYPNLNVKIAATHAGISVGEDGATHQSIEDIALMRALPNMAILSPCDATQTHWAIEAAIKHPGPVYIRLGRLAVPEIHLPEAEFKFGKGSLIRNGNDVTLIATGLMTHEAKKAAASLASEGVSARVIDIHTIKPIDEKIIIKAAKETKGIVVAEEHSIIGGLGEAVAGVLVRNCPAKMAFVGIEDQFGKSGTPEALLEAYGLTSTNIATKAKQLIGA